MSGLKSYDRNVLSITETPNYRPYKSRARDSKTPPPLFDAAPFAVNLLAAGGLG